jgi:hypothetical protein
MTCSETNVGYIAQLPVTRLIIIPVEQLPIRWTLVPRPTLDLVMWGIIWPDIVGFPVFSFLSFFLALLFSVPLQIKRLVPVIDP